MHRAFCTLRYCRPCLTAQWAAPARSRPSDDWVPALTRMFSALPLPKEPSIHRPHRVKSRKSEESNGVADKDPSDVFGTLNKAKKRLAQTKDSDNSTRQHVDSSPRTISEKPAKGMFEPDKMEIEDLYGVISDPDFQKLREYEDGDQEALPKIIPFRQRPWWYLLHMKKLIVKQRLPQALEFFEVRMRVEDQVRPLRTVYDMLIAACGRAGYLKKAFQLYHEMKTRHYVPVNATYVGLFNACAECPTEFQAEALERAGKLRERMLLKGHAPNQIVYHSMIKAFGRCGDLVTAFQLADEMSANRIPIEDSTFNFLLMACISDKQSGLTHAIKVWRMLLKSGATPSLYHYNLLLKAIRDCQLGDPEFAAKELLPPPPRPPVALPGASVMKQLFQERREISEEAALNMTSEKFPGVRDVHESQSVSSQIYTYMLHPKTNWAITFERETRDRRKIPPPTTSDIDLYRPVFTSVIEERTMPNVRRKMWFEELAAEHCIRPSLTTGEASSTAAVVLRPDTNDSNIPDLLSPLGRRGTSSIVAIREMTPIERLQLVGGYLGILARMNRDDVVPDQKVLTQLIDVIPPTRVAEEDILKIAKTLRIKLDVDFYNLLIRKRSCRHDPESALDAFRQLERKKLLPNEMTFGCLAISCMTKAAAEELLVEMEKRELLPNIKIFGSFCTNAVKQRNISYLLFVLSKMARFKISPDDRMLAKMEQFRTETRKAIVSMERGQEVDELYTRESFKKGWNIFSLGYDSWLKRTPAFEEKHPWSVYGYRQKWPSLLKFEEEEAKRVAMQ